MKPVSEASERNRDPILAVLRQWFTLPGAVLEIGSGTGQHAVHFARHLPHLTWHPTDRAENLPGIRLWTEEADLPNLRPPQEFDVRDERWADAHELDEIDRAVHERVTADAEQAASEPLPNAEDALTGVFTDFVQPVPWTRRQPVDPRS